MKIERRGRSAAARQARGVDAIGEAFGYAEDGANGWHIERAVETRAEREAFEKLCARLYAKKWASEARGRDPERIAERQREWRRRNPEKCRAAVLRQLAKRRTGPRTETCRVCGRAYQTTKFSQQCSKKCANRFHGKARSAAKNRGLRNRGLIDAIVAVLASSPWLVLAQIVERVGVLDRRMRSSKGSIATALTGGLSSGRLVHDGAKMRRRYAVVGAEMLARIA